MWHVPHRMLAVVTAVLSLLLSTACLPAAAETTTAVSNAHRWIQAEAENPRTTADMRVDLALGLALSGADPAALAPTLQLISRGPGKTPTTGQAVKLLLLAAMTGRDVHAFGTGADGVPIDVRALTLAAVNPDGSMRDSSGRANTFTHALGVVALARTGGVPRAAVDHLLRQQCPEGFVSLLPGSGSCDQDHGAASLDTTAIAIHAFIALSGSDPALASAADKAAQWLAAQQGSDGGFGMGPGQPANANTTGLAAAALRASGLTAAADSGRAWIEQQQLGSGPDAGAIAYDAATLSQRAPDAPIPASARASWQLAGAQAIAAFAPAPFATACVGCTAATSEILSPATAPAGSSTAPAPSTSAVWPWVLAGVVGAGLGVAGVLWLVRQRRR